MLLILLANLLSVTFTFSKPTVNFTFSSVEDDNVTFGSMRVSFTFKGDG